VTDRRPRSGISPWLIVAGVALLPVVVLLAAAPPGVAAPAGRNICLEPADDATFYQVEADPRFYYQCDSAQRPTRLKCPSGSLFSVQNNVCATAGEVATRLGYPHEPTLTAKPAQLSMEPLKLGRLSVTMRPGLIGETITFTSLATGALLCTATTELPLDSATTNTFTTPTTASCTPSHPGGPASALLAGYRATYAGNDMFVASGGPPDFDEVIYADAAVAIGRITP
jgi:chitin binding peritrophin-A-like protein with CBM14 domain